MSGAVGREEETLVGHNPFSMLRRHIMFNFSFVVTAPSSSIFFGKEGEYFSLPLLLDVKLKKVWPCYGRAA